MANIINSLTSGVGGVDVASVDTSGDLNIQSGGSTKIAVTSAGAAITGTLSATSTVSDASGTLRPLVSGTAVASTSGTSIDFTGIPSWVKRITVMFSGVSLSGASYELVQIGTGSTPTTSGYVASCSFATIAVSSTGGQTSTTGFPMLTGNAAYVISGHMTITNISGNIWVASGILANTATTPYTGQHGGTVTLGGTLGMVRITTANGTDTFDGGTINIMYE